jgi:NADH:ubiquinone oxidoreductase subunit E/NAD-dependent dihydropyrimidine dehydrogenase PreA subunit
LFKTQLVIDGKKVKVRGGATILEAARHAGIEIPTLCHVEGHQPPGVCRVCVVEIEGARTLAGSCHTPVSDGMVVHTRSPRVLAARRGVVELMLAAHTGHCVNDPNAGNCGLHNLASDQQVGAPRFEVAAPRFFPLEDDNPYVRRELSKCILCRKCITACDQMAGKNVLALGYRGFRSKIITGCDDPLAAEVCRDCGLCIEHCPTGALRRAEGSSGEQRKARPRRDSRRDEANRAELLPMLKQEAAAQGCLSKEALEDAATKTGLSLSEVYGVASFYSFLPQETKVENRIRICRCVPCEMKDARMMSETLEGELGIKAGEATPDGKFGLEVVSCIGACDQAPAMLINDRLFGDLTDEKIRNILKQY